MKIRTCRECKISKKLSSKNFSKDRGKFRRLCKACASLQQSVRYKGQGAAGRKKALQNWRAHFARDPGKARFILSKAAAKQSGHKWALHLEQYRHLNMQPCHYCQGPLPSKGRGLDRLNNKKGYVIGNVVSCCADCNALRGDRLTPEETKLAVTVIMLWRRMNGKCKDRASKS